MTGNIPYTPRVKTVLAIAGKEAKALNHSYLGTEHILLGLLREGGSHSARVFSSLGITHAKVRDEVRKELDPNFLKDPKAMPPRGATTSRGN
jgi:ATP-dependent Clp protease ATP-binding subunit ClpC